MSTHNGIAEIVRIGENLCSNIDMIILMERKFNDEIMLELERMSWEMMVFTDNLKAIKERFGE